MIRICIEENCTKIYYCKGYCHYHYYHFRNKRRDNVYHGLSRTKEYEIWGNIVQRCTNPKKSNYKYYGGRGVKICDRWRDSFVNFYKDVGKRPSPLHWVERIDNSGDYEPSNVCWATAKQQAGNRRPRTLAIV